jgi:hypothetical protein
MRTPREAFHTRKERVPPLTSSRSRSLTTIQYSYEMSQTSSHGRVLAGRRVSFQLERKDIHHAFGLYTSYPHFQALDVKLAKQAEQFLSMFIAPGEVISCSQAFPSLCVIGFRGAEQVNRAILNTYSLFSMASFSLWQDCETCCKKHFCLNLRL